MARLIEKKKGYNTYLHRVVFAGYGLEITIRLHVPASVMDLTPVPMSLTQMPLLPVVSGKLSPDVFFGWFYAKQVHEKPFEDAVRLIRRLAELCVAADFELLEKDMVRLAFNSNSVIRLCGDTRVRPGSVRRKARKID